MGTWCGGITSCSHQERLAWQGADSGLVPRHQRVPPDPWGGQGRSWQSRRDSHPAVKGQLEQIKALVVMSFPFP